ncbi:hypothetical protein RR48_14620 [Papilio machaon]|uniref:Uncharacterized protein n=1 Tax=Papilio machaon TaxID=76193 RepID=A0A194QKT6_PAPMA|nr:hypothetical protein RR48_14620 [Papilio machaon]
MLRKAVFYVNMPTIGESKSCNLKEFVWRLRCAPHPAVSAHGAP